MRDVFNQKIEEQNKELRNQGCNDKTDSEKMTTEEIMKQAGFINWNQFKWDDLVNKFRASSSSHDYIVALALKEIETAKVEVAKEILDELDSQIIDLDIEMDDWINQDLYDDIDKIDVHNTATHNYIGIASLRKNIIDELRQKYCNGGGE